MPDIRGRFSARSRDDYVREPLLRRWDGSEVTEVPVAEHPLRFEVGRGLREELGEFAEHCDVPNDGCLL
jgi:hypothetical protein